MATSSGLTTFRRAARPLALTALSFFLAGFLASPTARAERPERVRTTDQSLGVENPRNDKEQALERLTDVRDALEAGASGVGDPETALQELDDAIEELEESLDPEFWVRDEEGDIDGLHLDPEDGHHVFHEERHAAQEIFDAIVMGEIEDVDLREELLAIVDVLAAADGRLAEIAIEDALEAGSDPEEIEEALEQLFRGDDLVEKAAGQANLALKAAHFYTAMDRAYRHAWQEAIEASG